LARLLPLCDDVDILPQLSAQLKAVSVPLRLNPLNQSCHRVQPVGFKLLKWLPEHYENHSKCRIIVHKFQGCRYEIHSCALGWMTSLHPMVSPGRGGRLDVFPLLIAAGVVHED
jgi:hypothetical protein